MEYKQFLNYVTGDDEFFIVYDKEGNIVYPITEDAQKRILNISENGLIDPTTHKPYEIKEFTPNDDDISRIIRYTDASYELDATTKIFVKKKIYDEIDKYITMAKKNDEEFVLVMADADEFKSVNESYGHSAGDAVLKSIAQRMCNRVRTGNDRGKDLIGRYGGEEFLFVIKNVGYNSAFDRVENIRTDISDKAVTFDGKNIDVRVSFGIVHIPTETISFFRGENVRSKDIRKIAIKEADRQLDFSKKNGKNKTTGSVLSKKLAKEWLKRV